jgi:two-component system, OmpR family, phosphate regulon sensor histidine kinase PhoR
VTFAGRLIVGTVLTLVLTVFVLVWTSEVSLRRDLETEIARSLENQAVLIREALPRDSLQWESTVRRLGNQNGIRITIIDSNGRVRAESELPEFDLNRLENHLTRPEVQQAMHGQVGVNRRTSATLGRPLMYVAVPGGPGVVRVAATLEQVDATVHRAQRSVLWAALLALVIGSVIALVAGRSIAGPLTEITSAARSIAAGAPPRFPHSGIPDIDALVSALRDMNAQLAERFDTLRRERAESATLLESMVEGVLASDARGRIVVANGAARRLLGYGPTQELPELPQLFRAKPAREIVDTVLQGLPVDRREIELDDRRVRVDGRSMPGGGVMLVMDDVTDLRRLETMRRDFVANVSHEMKTPLTSITGYTETLLGEQPDPATSRRFLEVILANARRMQRLVDGLLDLARIESGGWRPATEMVDLAATVREVWETIANRGPDGRPSLEVAIPEEADRLRADPDAIRQVLTNLLENAIHYTPATGRIAVSSRRVDRGVTVAVEDSGSGISSEHLPRIFERFYRADPSRSRLEGGSGLGLAIVKHLVEAHGGRVAAESTLGQGTAIRCWFPDEVA